jgi:cation:H+ antiporter
VAIERSGSELADRIGLSGAVFGATILAVSTALPEVSTGLASIKLGDHELAFADIFGSNAFLPVLFVVAELIAGSPALQPDRPRVARGLDPLLPDLAADRPRLGFSHAVT